MEAKTIAIVGLNASGKTQWVERMRRELKSDSLRYVAFCDTYGTAADRSYYLQQRWNQHDIDEEMPTVEKALERAFHLSGSDTPARRQLQAHLYQLLGMTPLLDNYVISLSSGELRKMQLVKTLMANPKTLILDNPFIGLDAEARAMLSQQLLRLKEQGITLYLVLARPNEIPAFADDIIWTSPQQIIPRVLSAPPQGDTFASRTATLSSPTVDENGTSDAPKSPPIIELHNVSIRYGERTILAPLSWTVCQGEHWAVSGSNGSGKSTLLSLICADNPQSYACDITLFGRPRGTGESIWDIKQHIGYVSPELHRSYQRNLPVINVVASGLKNTVGLYTRFNEQERNQCLHWMRCLGIEELADRSFLQISSGEQRMILVARAFVKDPDLLILDEPMHGLDLQRLQLVKNTIDDYCQDPGKTLIMVTHYEEELPQCIDHRLYL